MFLRMLMGVAALVLIAVQAFAAPGRPPLEPFFKGVSSKSKKSYEEVKNEAVNVLRESGKYSENDIARVVEGRTGEMTLKVEQQMIRDLQSSKRFKLNSGLEALRIVEATDTYANSLDAINLKNLKNNVELALVSFELSELKFRIVLEKRNASESVENEARAQFLKSMKDYTTAVRHLLVEAGIPFKQEANEFLGFVIPNETATLKLIEILKADPRFIDKMSARPTLFVEPYTAGETSFWTVDHSGGKIYVGTDILLKL